MKSKFFAAMFMIAVCLGVSADQSVLSAPSSFLVPAGLRCEDAADPLGVDVSSPSLSWHLEAAGVARGKRQTAYRILAASSATLLTRGRGDLWDTGKVASDKTLQVIYGGHALKSAQQVFWAVQVWDEAGAASVWSKPATWTMGLLTPSDWQARWIGAPGTASQTGFRAADASQENEVKWVQVDLGSLRRLSYVQLFPMNYGGQKGFGFPRRFKVEAATDPDFQKATVLLDVTGEDYPNPGAAPVTIPARDTNARYVRLTATKLWTQDAANYTFALRQMEVISNGRNFAVGRSVTAKDSVQAPGWSETALTDGQAPGIIPSALLRREFPVKPKLRRALLFVCGLGQYELSVNGQRVGDALLSPGWSLYPKTCLYDTYDVTALLKPGTNAVGLILGHGMYDIDPDPARYVKFIYSAGLLKAIAQIRLEYTDSSVQAVGTDARWQVGPGPITFDNIFAGEDYDARLEPTGWDCAGFAPGAAWKSAEETTGPGGTLKGLTHAAPPIKMIQTLTPVKVTPLTSSMTVYDLGQNASVMPRLAVHGPAGSFVRIIPSELLKPDGTVDRASVTQDGVRPAWWQYTLKGGARENWFPKFFYQGSRYFQVELHPADGGTELPTVEKLAGVVVHSSSPPIGEFSASNDLFNKIFSLVRWAERSNMMSLMTDCPHRERLGWLEETELNGPSLRYNFDMAPLMAKVENDMADSQLPNGFVPNIAPEYFTAGTLDTTNGFRNSPEWGSAFLLVPWQQYQFSGDLSLLRRHYDDMKRYVAFLASTAPDDIVPTGLGDWYDVGPKPAWGSQLTPVAFTATAFYYYDNTVLAQAAQLLGKTNDARQFTAEAQRIRTSFNKKFYNAATGVYATGSQCCDAIPLAMGLAEPAQRAHVMEALIADIRAHGNALTTGEIGYRFLLRALSEGGHADVVYALNNQTAKPGYGYQIAHGGTSLAEKWDGSVGSFGSQDHFMSGEIIEWFYHDLVGIGQEPDSAGFQKIIIKPAVVGDLTWVRGRYNSVRGPISVEWHHKDGKVTLTLTIPPNAAATVYVPTSQAGSLTESDHPAAQAPGVRLLPSQPGFAVCAVTSGTYSFSAPFTGN